MSIPRMRTITEALAEIKWQMPDPQSQQTVSGLYVRTDKCDVSIRGAKLFWIWTISSQ